MSFLRNRAELPGRLVHHTGSMIRFTTSQLDYLPIADTDCELRLPDGAILSGRFHRHPQNPYIGGAALVGWIKSWVPYAQTAGVTVSQVGRGKTLRLDLLSSAKLTPTERARNDQLRAIATRLRREPHAERRRRLYASWERDPAVRAAVLAAWGAHCQVARCALLKPVPIHLRERLVDVHHLNHVGKGGTDSPLNLSILCVAHHSLIHRAPVSALEAWDLDHALVVVNGLTLVVRRNARLIL